MAAPPAPMPHAGDWVCIAGTHWPSDLTACMDSGPVYKAFSGPDQHGVFAGPDGKGGAPVLVSDAEKKWYYRAHGKLRIMIPSPVLAGELVPQQFDGRVQELPEVMGKLLPHKHIAVMVSTVQREVIKFAYSLYAIKGKSPVAVKMRGRKMEPTGCHNCARRAIKLRIINRYTAWASFIEFVPHCERAVCGTQAMRVVANLSRLAEGAAASGAPLLMDQGDAALFLDAAGAPLAESAVATTAGLASVAMALEALGNARTKKEKKPAMAKKETKA